MESSTFNNLGEVEEKIGYKFNDPCLLREALTHPSYQEIVDGEVKFCDRTKVLSYERLEYIGDSILNLLMVKEDLLLYPHLKPGMLTGLRAANVDTEKLARVAVRHNFHNHLLHNVPLLSGKIDEFIKAISHYPLRSNGLVYAPKILADIIESTIGAIYVDCNFSMDMIWEWLRVVQPIITPETLEIHLMTKLYEICQKDDVHVTIVDLWEETGKIEVLVNDEFAGREEFYPKNVALNRAANDAYNHIIESKYDDFNIATLFLEETI